MRDYRKIIRERRENLGLSQHKLAQRLNITPTFMCEIESGRKTPSLEVFFRICETLEIKLFPDERQEDSALSSAQSQSGKET